VNVVLLFSAVVFVVLGLLWQLQRLLAYSSSNHAPITWRDLAIAAVLLVASVGLIVYLTQ
jgi:hypothetical protein